MAVKGRPQGLSCGRRIFRRDCLKQRKGSIKGLPSAPVVFDSVFGIGIDWRIADIPADNRMPKQSKKQPANRLARSESAVRDQEERLRAILETAVEGIITIDERGIVESFNPAAEHIFGYTPAEVIGRNVNMLMAAPHREAHDGYLHNYLRTGQARIIGIGRETFARRKDGTLFPIDLSVSEVALSDRRLFTGFIRDITERKRLEKEILEISEREILQYAGRQASIAIKGAGESHAGPAIGDVTGCAFGSNTPMDFHGVAQDEQLLTRGYARE